MQLSECMKTRINVKSISLQLCGIIAGIAFLMPGLLKENFECLDALRRMIQSVCIIIILLRIGICYWKSVLQCLPLYVLGVFSLILVIPRVREDNLSTALGFSLSLCSLFLFFLMEKEEIVDEVLKGLLKYLLIIVWINVASVFIFPDGLYDMDAARKRYFLGHVNGMIKFYLPTWVLLGYQQNRMGAMGKLFWSTWVACAISLLIGKSYVSVLGAVIFLITYLFFQSYRGHCRDGRIILLGSFLIYQVMQFDCVQKGIMQIGNSIGKTTSVRTRLQMLEQAKSAISGSTWLGYGYLSEYSRYIHLDHNYYPTSAHNLFLDIMLNTGTAGLMLFLIFLVLCMSGSNKNEMSKETVFLAGLCTWGVMWNFEPYFTSEGIYLLMAIMGICQREGGEQTPKFLPLR